MGTWNAIDLPQIYIYTIHVLREIFGSELVLNCYLVLLAINTSFFYPVQNW